MTIISPIKQPDNIVTVASYDPNNTGILMGVNITITDLLSTQISVIETSRGIQGYTGPKGSGFRFFTDSSNNSLFIEASGTSDTLYLASSGSAQLSFDNTTKTLTIGAQPFDTGLVNFPINVGGTNNNTYDVNYLLYYDGSKITSSNVNAIQLSNFMTSGTNLKIGDGNSTTITYNIKDNLNIVGSTGIQTIYDDITNTISIAYTGKKTLSPLVASIIFG